MEFTFVTEYDQKTYTTVAKVLRKTFRMWGSLILRAFCLYFVAMTISLLLMIVRESDDVPSSLPVVLPPAVFILLVFVLIFWGDSLTGYLAKRQAFPGMERTVAEFTSESYIVSTDTIKSEYRYKDIAVIAETTDYFVFALDKRRAHAFSKKGMSNGSPEDFRRFIEEKTNKRIAKVKG